MPPASPRASVLSTAAERPQATSWSASIGACFWPPWPHHVLERRCTTRRRRCRQGSTPWSTSGAPRLSTGSGSSTSRVTSSKRSWRTLISRSNTSRPARPRCARLHVLPTRAEHVLARVDQPLRGPDRVLVHRVGGPARILADAARQRLLGPRWEPRVASQALVPPTICSRARACGIAPRIRRMPYGRDAAWPRLFPRGSRHEFEEEAG
jgi:hypothetical protein